MMHMLIRRLKSCGFTRLVPMEYIIYLGRDSNSLLTYGLVATPPHDYALKLVSN